MNRVTVTHIQEKPLRGPGPGYSEIHHYLLLSRIVLVNNHSAILRNRAKEFIRQTKGYAVV